ncbi:transcriptional regulator GcvA [Pseudoruegeria sp. SHC-113]|uniref:transcriptional regulator GcvA n=1 Tax=Pseudoruegeria sp. SHC-113 TaxID=2855439 RepID=UPI0021BA47BC|nr:transcriptional regulator GcvA [Pseudoruegeria sp. SHC-113]MCT8158943.1 transcriptional regulator GcvA [Pseudoruegeria sp. SHC-113]
MPDRLPPLTALRAFEAAARHLSFAKAAAELNVTPAALSFQIKSLEAHFGQPLFLRLNRAVELTAAGKALSPGATEGFDQLASAWRSARRLSESNTLSVTAGPAFTAKWLAPRLYQFAQDHPEIELRFAASLKMADLARDDVDVAIRFGASPDTGLHSRPLAREWLTPVMTPEMHARFPTIESLKEAPLLHDDSIAFLEPPCDWHAWFQAVGVEFAATRGARFTQADHAIDAALNGAGVVLGRRGFIVKDIAEGRLVAPFRTALAIDAHFRFVCLPGSEARPAIRAFHDWITAEIAKLSYISEEFTFVDVKDLPR